ncbi:MAG TPA: deoxyribose-phosphate aldolase [Acidobacteriota bacterium]|nr:deoxyribose-phosphate aldolase [Acidobacteriota bacterium]
MIECGAQRLGFHADKPSAAGDLARYIDHTLLKPTATRSQIEKLCQEARQYRFASVCINPSYVGLAADQLKGTAVAVCTVVGFPLGANAYDVKAYEARRAICDGADEIDMVINIGALKGNQDDVVLRDIAAVTEACHDSGAICKVIIEAAYLNEDEKVRACQLSKKAHADFVKTSTGFGPGGATLEDVALMRRTVGSEIGVKAAGGIGDSEATRKMLEAGATRIGASAGIKIVQGEKGSEVY